ncbi:agmatinase [Mycoplana sp. BE70]|uniref:agmatinase n=1 Tax=Mycoplana sp. BE70 TaxID=2817775 RepID=UPI0038620BAE
MLTPEYKRIAEIISERGRREFPYSGMPTLLDAPARMIDPDGRDLEGLQVALFGVPMDLAVTNRAGSRFGPRALRSIERVGPYNDALGCAPVHEMAVADIGDVPFRSRFDLTQSHEDIEHHVEQIVQAGVIPLAVGGDHSITHPILKALGRDHPVGLVHIDAHCDTAGPYDGEKFHHGGPFRNAVLDGALDPTRTIQIGIRGSAEYVWEFSTISGMTVVHARDVSNLGIPAIVAKVREVVGDGPTYLSFDIDSLDPSFAPGTGTPEVGGLTTREALALLRGMKGLNLVGGDVVEVAPAYDPTTNTAQTGAQVLFEILSLLMFSPSLKREAKA